MLNKHIMRTISIFLIITFFLPGCEFTSTQITALLTGSNGLVTSTIDVFWNDVVTPTLNPQDNPYWQNILDVSQATLQDAAANQINRNIPVTPGTSE